MKTTLTLLLLIISAYAFSQSGEKNFIDLNYIEITGKAEMEVVPDEIYLNIIIDEKENKKKQSLEELEKLMIGKLTAIGIDISKDLAIKDMASNFKFYWLKNNKIFTSKAYQLVVHEGKIAGRVFQELEKIDISNISIEKVDHSKIEDLRAEVKMKAMQAAKNKASYLAGAIDQTIGNALYIREIESPRYELGRMKGVSNIAIRGASSFAQEAVVPDIEFEKIKLEYSILARFELK